MKQRFWITDQGILATSRGNFGISNAKEISRYQYYKLLKERR